MEKRLNKKIEDYICEFKNEIKDRAVELDILQDEKVNQLMAFVFDYERLAFEKDDFVKRKRVKNIIPYFDRCFAKRANNEQCTRRKKDGCEYCGTHMKGTPHGLVDAQVETVTTQKVEVWAQDIMGIIYYIDKNGNVYQAEDVVVNKVNPKIIAKYVKNGESYSIPAFGVGNPG
jgi:hypothetical protein